MSDPRQTRDDILGAVLVGGRSRRMGRDKARMELRGRPLALHVAGVLKSALDEVVLVGGERVEERFPGFPSVRDRFPGAGPLAGLHAALCSADPGHADPGHADSGPADPSHAADSAPEARAVFLAACDLPGLSPELVLHLVACAGDPRRTASPRAWIPRLEDRVQPLAAVYSPGCLPVVESLLQRGERTVHRFLDRISVTTVPLTPDLPFYHPDLLANLNRPGDLERFDSRWTP